MKKIFKIPLAKKLQDCDKKKSSKIIATVKKEQKSKWNTNDSRLPFIFIKLNINLL